MEAWSLRFGYWLGQLEQLDQLGKFKAMSQIIKTKKSSPYFIHPTAIIEEGVVIGSGAKIWHFAQIRSGTIIGENCIIGKSVFIDSNTQIGKNSKIQNHALIYHQAIIEDGVFIGPNVCFANDLRPRAINPNGSQKGTSDWRADMIKIGYGASIGAHSVIIPGLTIGRWAMAGSGSVITHDVPDYALVYGNPARVRGFVCPCGKKLIKIISKNKKNIKFKCACKTEITIPINYYQLIDKK